MKFMLNEIKGKLQGEMIVVDAETPQLAIEKLKNNWNVVEVIKPYEKFSKMHFFGKTYSMYEYGKPEREHFIVYLEKAVKETKMKRPYVEKQNDGSFIVYNSSDEMVGQIDPISNNKMALFSILLTSYFDPDEYMIYYGKPENERIEMFLEDAINSFGGKKTIL